MLQPNARLSRVKQMKFHLHKLIGQLGCDTKEWCPIVDPNSQSGEITFHFYKSCT